MKVIWWTISQKDESGQRRVHESERHAVEYFSSAYTYCGCSIPLDFADVYAVASQNVTCERCMQIVEADKGDN